MADGLYVFGDNYDPWLGRVGPVRFYFYDREASSTSTKSTGSSGSAVTGIWVGVVAFVTVLAAFFVWTCYFCLLRAKGNKAPGSLPETQAPPTPAVIGGSAGAMHGAHTGRPAAVNMQPVLLGGCKAGHLEKVLSPVVTRLPLDAPAYWSASPMLDQGWAAYPVDHETLQAIKDCFVVQRPHELGKGKDAGSYHRKLRCPVKKNILNV